MKINNRKNNWVIDAALFAAFLCCFWLDLTGVSTHQWLGVGLIVLAGYHLLVHFGWVKAVTLRFFSRAKGAARLNYLVDFALLIGFAVILVTGLQISTWFSLPYESISIERHLHIQASIMSLMILVLKIGLHWRWILQTPFRKTALLSSPVLKTYPLQAAPRNMQTSRREFLKLMGATSGAAFLSIIGVLDALSEEQPLPDPQVMTLPSAAADQIAAEAYTTAAVEATSKPSGISKAGPANLQTEDTTLGSEEPLSSPTAISTPESTAVEPAIPAVNCFVRCDRGCSYPGHCRKYRDQNGNGLCDLGECM